MASTAKTPGEFMDELPEDRKIPITRLKKIISKNLPKGFSESIGYGMLSYSVPHSIYPKGYHCDPKQQLPFVSLASQKNFIALYHMGIYAIPELHDWFVKQYPLHSKKKLDMGKSCIRFKKSEDIPYELIGELMQKVSVKEWIAYYESVLQKK